jgi:hypothetical protein
VIKMAVESAQLLSTAMWQRGLDAPYRPTHVAHPAVRWTGTNRGNYRWVLRHFEALVAEYHRRFGRAHASSRWSAQFRAAMATFPPGRRGPFVNLSSHPRISPTTKAYRRRLWEKWRSSDRSPRWTHSRMPRWARPPHKTTSVG